MLQPINPNALAPLSAPGGEALPAGFAQTQAGGGEAQAFDLHLVLRGFVAAAPSTPEPVAVEPAAGGEADAEQWLANVLGQQAVRVEAREAPETREPAVEAGDPLAGLVLPAQAQQPLPREAMAGLPAQPVELPVAGRQAQPLAVQAAALPLQAAGEPLASAPSLAPVGGEALTAGLLEQLPSAAGEGDQAAPSSAAASQSQAQPLASERSLKLPAAQAQWGEQMLHSLREQVELQINQRIQNATIRLDPPELGSLEIYLSHKSGRLNVQLSAANGEVARLLQQTSERLRQELVGQHFVQVNVQVSADAQGGRQHQQAPRQAWLVDEPVQAASASATSAAHSARDSTSDVLVTV